MVYSALGGFVVSTIRIPSDLLRSWCIETFERLGVFPDQARIAADNLIAADLRGIYSHGLARVDQYAREIEAGKINTRPQIQILQERTSTLLVDADHALGPVAGTWAMRRCIAKARQTGIACASVGNGCHYGIAAYYAALALPEDMIGIASCDTPAIVAVHGGMDRVLGTNPLCVAIPAATKLPLVFDAATSEAAFNRIVVASQEHREIPPTWAIDREGRPTTDPGQAIDGGAGLPFGSYKGSGLSVAIQTLNAVLSGNWTAQRETIPYGTPQSFNVGYFFVAIDIAAFQDVATFKEGVDNLIGLLTAGRKRPDCPQILMPGEPEELRTAEQQQKGIVVGPGVYAALVDVGQRYGVSIDLAPFAG